MNTSTQKNKTSKTIGFHFKLWSLQALICITIVLGSIQSLFSHGTVTNPPSRVWICFQENPENPDSPACIAGVASHGTQWLYDWPAILPPAANSNHMDFVMDGNLASGGDPTKYGGMDQVRDDWVSTPVTPGPYTITWTITAQHATLYYDVYITKADWTTDQPLTWDSLELLVRTGERPLATEDNIDVILPARTGKHVIYSVWQRSLSQEAFYSTSDVDFGTTLSIDGFDNSSSGIKQNYPNPVIGSTTIEYSLKKESFVSLKVYNILGKEVAILSNSIKSAGKHEVVFSMDNLISGMYFYIFTTEDYVEMKRMILQR